MDLLTKLFEKAWEKRDIILGVIATVLLTWWVQLKITEYFDNRYLEKTKEENFKQLIQLEIKKASEETRKVSDEKYIEKGNLSMFALEVITRMEVKPADDWETGCNKNDADAKKLMVENARADFRRWQDFRKFFGGTPQAELPREKNCPPPKQSATLP